MISHEEGMALADSLGVPYKENSALNGEGTVDVLNTAVRTAANYRSQSLRKQKSSWLSKWIRSRRSKEKAEPPVLPPAGM